MDRIRKWSIAGVVVTLVTGTLLHFVHEWFGGGFWASIGAVNESTWEHLKLIFWPMFLFGICLLYTSQNFRPPHRTALSPISQEAASYSRTTPC